jgi:hypothetical protein
MAAVEEVEVVVAHHERATLRVDPAPRRSDQGDPGERASKL